MKSFDEMMQKITYNRQNDQNITNVVVKPFLDWIMSGSWC